MSLLCQCFSSLRIWPASFVFSTYPLDNYHPPQISPNHKVLTFPIEISLHPSFNIPFLNWRVQIITFKPHPDRKLERTTAPVDLGPALSPLLKIVTYLQRLQCVCEFLYHWIIIRCYKYSFRFSFLYNLFGFLEDFTLWWQAHLISEFLVGARLDALRWCKEGGGSFVFNMITSSFLKTKFVKWIASL